MYTPNTSLMQRIRFYEPFHKRSRNKFACQSPHYFHFSYIHLHIDAVAHRTTRTCSSPLGSVVLAKWQLVGDYPRAWIFFESMIYDYILQTVCIDAFHSPGECAVLCHAP